MKKILRVQPTTLIFAFILLTFFYFALSHLRFPLIMDEIEYPLVGKAVSETFKAFYYRGEYLPSNLGLWHTPLYTVLLGVYFKFVPFLTSTARFFGVLTYGLSALLFYFWYK